MPVHNRRETTLQCLRSLSRIDRSGLEIHIFIVDDGSTDGTSEAIREAFPDVSIIDGDGGLHYAAGTNRGISAAMDWGAEFVVTMNDDSVFHEQFLQRLVEAAKTNARSVVGALLLLWNEPHRVFQVAPNWKTFKGGWIFPDNLTAFSMPQKTFAVEAIVGNCVLIPAAATRECGLMDEKRFPHGWGDTQYFDRLRHAGWNLLVEPRSYVWCEPNTYPPPLHRLSLGDVLKVLFVNTRHPVNLKRQFVARWHSAPSKSKAVASFLVFLTNLTAKALKYRFSSQPQHREQ